MHTHITLKQRNAMSAPGSLCILSLKSLEGHWAVRLNVPAQRKADYCLAHVMIGYVWTCV